MAKAQITTKDGTKITIEFSPKEISSLMKQLELNSSFGKGKPKDSTRAGQKSKRRSQKATPTNLIESLIDGGFFKKPKALTAIKEALEEIGHPYPVTHLSPTLLRSVRKKQLRRIKDKNRWLYIAIANI